MSDYRTEIFAGYHRHSARVDGDAVERRDWFATYASRTYLPHLADFDRSTGRVLEIGCNKGFLLHALQHAGFESLTGIDMAAEELAEAKRHVPAATLEQADALTFLQRHRDAYDAIVMKAVLEHLDRASVVPVLRAISASLKRGGVALIDVPNMDWLFAGHERYMDFTHEGGFTRESLHQVVELAFDDVEVYPVETEFPGRLGLARRRVARLVVGTLLRWADPGGGMAPIWQRGLLAVARVHRDI